jgi:hypothetical protein
MMGQPRSSGVLTHTEHGLRSKRERKKAWRANGKSRTLARAPDRPESASAHPLFQQHHRVLRRGSARVRHFVHVLVDIPPGAGLTSRFTRIQQPGQIKGERLCNQTQRLDMMIECGLVFDAPNRLSGNTSQLG